MSYFRKPLSGITRGVVKAGPRTTTTFDPSSPSALRTEALRLKPNWPRCDVEVTDHRTNPPTKTVRKGAGYLYEYSDVSMCRTRWDINEAVNVLAGRARVAPPRSHYGSDTELLCLAQGNKEYQDIADRRGLLWKTPGYDTHGHAHNPVAPKDRRMCVRYVEEQGGTKASARAYAAHYYSTVIAPTGGAHDPTKTPRTRVHGETPGADDLAAQAKQQKTMLYGAIAFAGILTTALIIKKRKK